MFGIADNTEFLTAIGINDAPEDVKAKLIADIETIAQNELIIAISDRVTDEKAEAFGNITDEQQAKDWLKQHIPDLDKVASDILANIQADIINHKTEILGA